MSCKIFTYDVVSDPSSPIDFKISYSYHESLNIRRKKKINLLLSQLISV